MAIKHTARKLIKEETEVKRTKKEKREKELPEKIILRLFFLLRTLPAHWSRITQ